MSSSNLAFYLQRIALHRKSKFLIQKTLPIMSSFHIDNLFAFLEAYGLGSICPILLILYGKSEIGAHVRSNFCYAICLGHLIDRGHSQIDF